MVFVPAILGPLHLRFRACRAIRIRSDGSSRPGRSSRDRRRRRRRSPDSVDPPRWRSRTARPRRRPNGAMSSTPPLPHTPIPIRSATGTASPSFRRAKKRRPAPPPNSRTRPDARPFARSPDCASCDRGALRSPRSPWSSTAPRPNGPSRSRNRSYSATVTSCVPTASGPGTDTRTTGPSRSSRSGSFAGEPIRNSPAGTIAISGQSGQSRNDPPGTLDEPIYGRKGSRPRQETDEAHSPCQD